VAQVESVRTRLASSGVGWITQQADLVHSIRSSAAAVASMTRAALRIADAQNIELIHARGYQSAGVARVVRLLRGVPYLFDARGCWIEERAKPGDWFSGPKRYALGKGLERELYTSACAIVALTTLHATDIRAEYPGQNGPIEVIPTCTDYDDFELRRSRPDKPTRSATLSPDLVETLRNKTVIGVVGSLNSSYLVDAALKLTAYATRESRNIRLLVLSRQATEYLRIIETAGIPTETVTYAESRHEDIAEWLQWIDWGFLLLPEVAAKRGSMPTKLGEFFATGVRPLAHGCNSEMISWVTRSGSGLVLDQVDDGSLKWAASQLSRPGDFAALQRARDITEPHFGLKQGLDRYGQLLASLL